MCRTTVEGTTTVTQEPKEQDSAATPVHCGFLSIEVFQRSGHAKVDQTEDGFVQPSAPDALVRCAVSTLPQQARGVQRRVVHDDWDVHFA